MMKSIGAGTSVPSNGIEKNGTKVPAPEGYKQTKVGVIPEDWDVVKLGDVTDYVDYRGKTPKKVENGILLVTARNIKQGHLDYETSKEYIAKDDYKNVMSRGVPKIGDVLLTTEAPLGNIAQIDNENIALAQRVIKFRAKEDLDNTYLKYHFLSNKFQEYLLRLAIGTTVLGIQGKQLHKMLIPFPPLKEQQKIAQILTTWDDAIIKQEALIKAKEELKKGLMEKLLSGEVRFDGFDGEWKEVRFNVVFERITRKNTINNTSVLTISAQHGLINQEEFFNKSVASKDLSGYILLKNGEFAYNKSYSNGYPMGAVKRLNRYEQGVLSSLYIYFSIKDDNPDFYEHYFEAGFLNKEIYKIAQEGARNHGLLNMSVIEFFNDMHILKPSLEEQEKIAEVLTISDKEIDLLKNELEALKEQKRGLMQRLLTGVVRIEI